MYEQTNETEKSKHLKTSIEQNMQMLVKEFRRPNFVIEITKRLQIKQEYKVKEFSVGKNNFNSWSNKLNTQNTVHLHCRDEQSGHLKLKNHQNV